MQRKTFTPDLHTGVKRKTARRRGCSSAVLRTLHLIERGCMCIETIQKIARFGALSYTHTSSLRGVKCVKRPALLRFWVSNGCKPPVKLYRGVAA